MPSVLAIGPDDGQALGNEERNGESIVNVAEAMMVVEFLKFFRKAINMTEHTDKGGVKEASGSGDDVESMPTIGCICLYRAQSFLVKKGSQRCGVVHSPYIEGNRICIINNILQALQCLQWTTSQDLIRGLLLSQHAPCRALCIYPSHMLPSHNLLLCKDYRYLNAPCRA